MPEKLLDANLLDRPGQAFQNLLAGQPEAIEASLVHPEALTPKERDAFLKQYGLDKGPYTPIFRLMTNPVVLLSAALSLKFPVPTAENVFKYSEKVSGYLAKIPILKGLRSVPDLYRGTPVPEVYMQILRDVNDFRSKYAGEWGTMLNKYKQATGKLPNSRDQKLLALWLDGAHRPTETAEALAPNLEAYMSKPLLKLAEEHRGMLDNVWQDIFGSLESRTNIMNALAAAKRHGFSDDLMETLAEWAANPEKPLHYYPRRVLASDAEFRAMAANLTRPSQTLNPQGEESLRNFARSAQNKMTSFVGPNALRREGVMMPALGDLQEVKDVLDQSAFDRLIAKNKARILDKAKDVIGVETVDNQLGHLDYNTLVSEYGKHLDSEDAVKFSQVLLESKPREYSLLSSHSLNRYLHTMAGTYGWTVKGGGSKVVDILKDLRALKGDARAATRLSMLENTHIPMMLGRGTFDQALSAQRWDQGMMRMADTLDNPTIKGLLGTGLHKRLTDSMREAKGAFSLTQLSRNAAGYFYWSTLGLNPASALKNTLQLVLTTGPVVGYKTAAEGAAEALRKSHKYFALRFGKGLSHDEALRAAYKEFGIAGLASSPLTDEAVALTMENAYQLGAALPSGLATAKERAGRAMMRMFSLSEMGVRLSTFEAGLKHAKKSGLGLDDSIKFARQLTEHTQFLTGPQNTPYWLVDRNPLIRQMLQFPLRMLEFTTSTAVKLGSGEKNWFGYNPGTLSRMVLGSAVAAEAFRSLGVDESDALLGGALPGFQESGKVFAPLPIVPPAVQVAGSIASYMASGDSSELSKVAPLLVPAGVAASRAVGVVPGGESVARLIGRKYADYDSPSPTGRVGVFSSEGQLVGYFSPFQIFAQAMGVKPGDLQNEEQLRRMLVANRDDIRESRQSAIEAIVRNDPRTAESISRNFEKRYGFGISISQKDIRAAQLRRTIPRLEQVLQTLPPGPIREQYVQMIAGVLGSEGSQMMGIDPQMLSAPKGVKQAARFSGPRTQSQGPISLQGVGSQPYQQMGPTGGLNPASVSAAGASSPTLRGAF